MFCVIWDGRLSAKCMLMGSLSPEALLDWPEEYMIVDCKLGRNRLARSDFCSHLVGMDIGTQLFAVAP